MGVTLTALRQRSYSRVAHSDRYRLSLICGQGRSQGEQTLCSRRPSKPGGLFCRSDLLRARTPPLLGQVPASVSDRLPGRVARQGRHLTRAGTDVQIVCRSDWFGDDGANARPDVQVETDGPEWDNDGNIMQVLEACPNARLVTNFVGFARMTEEFDLPIPRINFANDGETFSAGDRTLVAIRPPYYDSPATRGLWDASTGVYIAADAFGAVVPEECEYVGDVDADVYTTGFNWFNRANSHGMRSPTLPK